MYIVMCLHKFDLDPDPRIPIEIKVDPGKMIGFAPIYNTRKDAEKDYPNHQILKIGFKSVGEIK